MSRRVIRGVLLAGYLVTLFGSAHSGNLPLAPRLLPSKPEHARVAPGHDRFHIEVKFTDLLDIGLNARGVPTDRQARVLTGAAAASLAAMATAGGRWERLFGEREARIDQLVGQAEARLLRDIADLNNYFVLEVPEGVRAEDWIDALNALPEVEIALALPLPVPPPSTTPPNFESLQGYLNAAPDGIAANQVWSLPGGTGLPPGGPAVKVCDFEYDWNLDHQDLPFMHYIVPPGFSPYSPFNDNNHGTAVMGELVSISNGWGTTGAVYEADPYCAPTALNNGWRLSTALVHASDSLGPGDVFLIEQQVAGPNATGNGQEGLVPVDWWGSVYNAVVTAVGNGMHVVEAAGNGGENLDAPEYNQNHAPFVAGNESGAIIVGAGYPPVAFGGTDVDRARLWYSCYGSRVNVQGWGRMVMTTGYGSHYSSEGTNLWYTRTFSGTSSASPIVTSAAVALESIYRAHSGGSPLDPGTMLGILTATGSPQQSGIYPASEHIGPRPDLVAAVDSLSLLFDADSDGVIDIADNCVFVANAGQEDDDLDAVGNACDNCPTDHNPGQESDDGDDIGNLCDLCPGVATVDNIVLMSADADNSGDLSSTDIIYLVNYLFKGGPEPIPCPAVADTNCDGVATSADILALVFFTFKGGPVPCEVCTVAPGLWDCR